MTTLTLETIAAGLKGKLWEKGNLRRVYLESGYNTKKMKTTTYVYQRENGCFGISCFIECPSQPMAWIRSQQTEIIESIDKAIKELKLELEQTSN